jgi:hypothetical protein
MSDVDKAQQGKPEQRDRSMMSEETPKERVLPRRDGGDAEPGPHVDAQAPPPPPADDRASIRENKVAPNPLLGPTENTRATYHTPQPGGERRREGQRDTTAARTPDQAFGDDGGDEE